VKTLVLLALDFWCYARWVAVKLVALTLRASHSATGIPGRTDYWTIRFGNALFPSKWPDALHDSYEDYDRLYPVDLRTYLSLVEPDEWLRDKVVLDLGAGLGGYSREMCKRGARLVVSLEYQHSKAAYAARHRSNCIFVVNASASALPFIDGTFDSILSHTVFEHLTDVPRALSEVRRVLRPGGRAMIGFNYFQHRGGHHLFPYIRFPWPTWVVSEQAACEYWSGRLRTDQQAGRKRFYPEGCVVRTLGEGNEIGLNRMTYELFEQLVMQAGLRIEKRLPSESLARLFPRAVAKSPLREFLTGTVFYSLMHV
jgi:SAM-dependent methyltransferase